MLAVDSIFSINSIMKEDLLMGNWWTSMFKQDMFHAQLFCVNFVIFFSSTLLSPYGMGDVLHQYHPRMFGLYMIAEVLALLFSASALIIFVAGPSLSSTRVPHIVALLSVLTLGSYSILLLAYGWFLFSAHLGMPLLAYVEGIASSVLLLVFYLQLPHTWFNLLAEPRAFWKEPDSAGDVDI